MSRYQRAWYVTSWGLFFFLVEGWVSSPDAVKSVRRVCWSR